MKKIISVITSSLTLSLTVVACQSSASSNNTMSTTTNTNDIAPVTQKETNSTPSTTEQKQEAKNNDNLSFLRDYNGKFPFDVSLLEHPILKKRLQALLKDRFEYLDMVLEVTEPMKVEGDMFYVWGMKAHSGGFNTTVIMTDLKKDVLYVGLRDEPNPDEFYSEDGSPVPEAVRNFGL